MNDSPHPKQRELSLAIADCQVRRMCRALRAIAGSIPDPNGAHSLFLHRLWAEWKALPEAYTLCRIFLLDFRSTKQAVLSWSVGNVLPATGKASNVLVAQIEVRAEVSADTRATIVRIDLSRATPAQQKFWERTYTALR